MSKARVQRLTVSDARTVQRIHALQLLHADRGLHGAGAGLVAVALGGTSL